MLVQKRIYLLNFVRQRNNFMAVFRKRNQGKKRVIQDQSTHLTNDKHSTARFNSAFNQWYTLSTLIIGRMRRLNLDWSFSHGFVFEYSHHSAICHTLVQSQPKRDWRAATNQKWAYSSLICCSSPVSVGLQLRWQWVETYKRSLKSLTPLS